MKLTIIFILTILLSACGRADLEAIKKGFPEYKDLFVVLHSMIKEDTKETSCFTVGTDRIGNFWEYDEEWTDSRNYQRKIAFEEVLKEVGISRQRYQEYLSMFRRTGALEVGYCPREPGWSRIVLYASGLGVSGCLTSVNINGDGSIPATDITPGYSIEITPFTDGWYLAHHCT